MAHPNRVSGGERIFPVTKQAKGIFSALRHTQNPLPSRPLYSAGICSRFLSAGLLCFERHGGWWGCSCCEINRRQMHFIGDSWTRCRHRRDPRAPAKIATYARALRRLPDCRSCRRSHRGQINWMGGRR